MGFLKKFLKLTGGILSAKTYERVISLIDCQELNKIFVDFVLFNIFSSTILLFYLAFLIVTFQYLSKK